MKQQLILRLAVVFPLNSIAFGQFVHTEHQHLVDGSGKPLLIRAINLGNWMAPEGYMWLLDGATVEKRNPGAGTGIARSEGSQAFWRKYRNGYITHDDIAFLHRVDFNALREPSHYGLFEGDDADGFKLLDYWLARVATSIFT